MRKFILLTLSALVFLVLINQSYRGAVYLAKAEVVDCLKNKKDMYFRIVDSCLYDEEEDTYEMP